MASSKSEKGADFDPSNNYTFFVAAFGVTYNSAVPLPLLFGEHVP